MQNNLATEIIGKLKKKIRILIVAAVIWSLLCAGLSVVYVRKAPMCRDYKNKAVKHMTEMFIQRQENGAAVMQKRRVNGKAHNV